ncbi:MAG: OsmC family protein [Acidobacteriota bacterium]|jgi:uncharacterized OsmC-like protein
MNTMTQEMTPAQKNGVPVENLFATIDAVKGQPELGRFQFRASNRWVKGTNSRSTMMPFTGAGGEHKHQQEFSYDADHHPVLCGEGKAPTPVEFLLHALASCLTAGIANIASARGVTLTEVESTIEGNIDLRGILGISEEVRNGYENIRVNFTIKGDAPAEKLQEIVEQSRARSAVFDVITNKVPVEIAVNAG